MWTTKMKEHVFEVGDRVKKQSIGFIAWPSSGVLSVYLGDHGMRREGTEKTQAQNYGRSMDGSNSFGVVGCDKTRAVLSAKVKLQPDRSVGKYKLQS